ncbi:MAG TPA: class I tRNA ligase family protein [Solirubrobacteraceae bacterium]|jgi:leucyl-tRNA synthetase|nr:class I tRNA ligase family protein [Solirubrobacteraceae bacterium]
MSEGVNIRYDAHAIEARRQAAWSEREAARTPTVFDDQPHLYIKPSAPFTSGNVHIGHVRSYSIGDAYARFRRARGDRVLFAFGFDAFGLPAELGAIAGGVPPSEWVARCAEHMTGQLQRLGFSFDWERTFTSSDPVMYRWSQWLFLTLLEAGLVYRGTGNVDWCDTCQTTLATIQVEDGLCWRCHNPVRLIERPTWYLRISAYTQENDMRLDELAAGGRWDEVALASQRFVLGRVDGVEVELSAGPDGPSLSVFTPHADSLELARFVLLSPKHPEIDSWVTDDAVRERLEELRSGGLERSSRDARAIALIDTGYWLPAPAGGDPLPVLISPAVDGRFGATAAFGVPEHDRTDEVIAERLPELLSASSAAAKPPTTASGAASTPRPAVRYKADDFSISRQRSWGTPIPIVYCDTHGAVPIPKEQLPVLLPLDITPTGTGNPLAELDDFVNTTCPLCDGPAKRETDTLDCHFDALWLWVPVAVPPESREDTLEEIFALSDLRQWLPSERVVAGSDSGNFVFDQRIVTKALRDIGPLEFLADGEPFAGCLFHEMVISDGRKMSKHLGNVVDPDALVERYGADTVRLAVLYAARPQKTLNWSDSAVLRANRFLTQVWEFSQTRIAAAEQRAESKGEATDAEGEPIRDTTEHLRLKLAQWCEKGAEKITEDMESLEMHSAVRNVMRLFDRIKDFDKRVLARQGALTPADSDALLDALALLAQLLGPFAPHVAEELWLSFGNAQNAPQTPWPGVSLGVAA